MLLRYGLRMIKTWHITGNTTNNVSPIRAVCGVALWSPSNLLPAAAVVDVVGRSTRVTQNRRDEDDAAAADSMSNLVVRTCAREIGRRQDREGRYR